MKFIITSTSGKKYDCFKTHEEKIKWSNLTHTFEGNFDVLEIESLESLLALVDELKEREDEDAYIDGIVINRWLNNEDYWAIEIYDDYRE